MQLGEVELEFLLYCHDKNPHCLSLARDRFQEGAVISFSKGSLIMTKPLHIVLCIAIVLLLLVASGQSQARAPKADLPTVVAAQGDSVLERSINGIAVGIAISTYQIDIPKNGVPPQVRENNCTYSRVPCSQVKNLRISVKGANLFVPRSVFADCADIRNMQLTEEAGIYILTLVGGDASEAYSVKIFFTADRVKKREIYALEANSMVQFTEYMPTPVLD